MATEYTPTEMMDRESEPLLSKRGRATLGPREIDLEEDVENLLEFIEASESYDRQSWYGTSTARKVRRGRGRGRGSRTA